MNYNSSKNVQRIRYTKVMIFIAISALEMQALFFKNLLRAQRKSSELRQQLNEKLCSTNQKTTWIVFFLHVFHIIYFK